MAAPRQSAPAQLAVAAVDRASRSVGFRFSDAYTLSKRSSRRYAAGFLAQDLKLTFPVEPLRPEEFQSVRKRPFFRHIAREALEV